MYAFSAPKRVRQTRRDSKRGDGKLFRPAVDGILG
jgi:hypothetical protein